MIVTLYVCYLPGSAAEKLFNIVKELTMLIHNATDSSVARKRFSSKTFLTALTTYNRPLSIFKYTLYST